MRKRIVILCALGCALASVSIRSARAQTTLGVPGPAQQNQPYIPPAPPPITRAPSDTDHDDSIQLLPPGLWQPAPTPAQPIAPRPPASVNAAPMTAQALPVLPAVFRGCWDGQVNQLDWIRREPGAHKVGFWTPKTYRLCYQRVGDQPFTLTFTETGVAPSEKIINPHGSVVPIDTDGRAYASMRSQLHFDEYKTHPDGWSPTFAVDETTNLDCRIGGDDMMVSADVFGARDGEPWFRAHWRADFRRFAQ